MRVVNCIIGGVTGGAMLASIWLGHLGLALVVGVQGLAIITAVLIVGAVVRGRRDG